MILQFLRKLIFQAGSPADNLSGTNNGTRLTDPIIQNLSPDAKAFYDKYDPMEGVTTASVLSGFFVFCCLTVLYKTKCKPMWKERNKRLYNTPATHSEIESTFSHLHKDFECIPLQTMHGGGGTVDDDDDDIYYLDEFGNYVFPLSPTLPGTCSCPHRKDITSYHDS